MKEDNAHTLMEKLEESTSHRASRDNMDFFASVVENVGVCVWTLQTPGVCAVIHKAKTGALSINGQKASTAWIVEMQKLTTDSEGHMVTSDRLSRVCISARAEVAMQAAQSELATRAEMRGSAGMKH